MIARSPMRSRSRFVPVAAIMLLLLCDRVNAQNAFDACERLASTVPAMRNEIGSLKQDQCQKIIDDCKTFLQTNSDAPVASAVRWHRCQDIETKSSQIQDQQQQVTDAEAGRSADGRRATQCDAASSTPIAKPFAPDLVLRHSAGEIRVRQIAMATSINIDCRPTFSALPGDRLVIVELSGEFSDEFKSTLGNFLSLENAGGVSVLAPSLQFEFVAGSKEVSRNPQSMLLLKSLVELVSPDKARTLSVQNRWIAVGAFKPGSSPVFLKLPCVAERVQLPGGT